MRTPRKIDRSNGPCLLLVLQPIEAEGDGEQESEMGRKSRGLI